MKRLIVNADDYGLSPGIDRGIRALAALGVVTSVSVLAERATAAAIGELRAVAPAVGIGLHVDFTHDLVHYDPRELMGRLQRQLARFCELVGAPPDHLDTHKQTHRDHRAVLQVLATQQLPMRAPNARVRRELRRLGVACPEHFVGSVAARCALQGARLVALCRTLGPGTTELMCHPAEVFDGDERLTYKRQREAEFRALLAARLPERLAAQGVAAVSFRALQR